MLKDGGRKKSTKGELMPHYRETEIWDELAIEMINKTWIKQEHYVST